VRVAAHGATLSDAARIEADHVILACKVIDVLQGAKLAKRLADAYAGPTGDE
jgi:hypothetical protein